MKAKELRKKQTQLLSKDNNQEYMELVEHIERRIDEGLTDSFIYIDKHITPLTVTALRSEEFTVDIRNHRNETMYKISW